MSASIMCRSARLMVWGLGVSPGHSVPSKISAVVSGLGASFSNSRISSSWAAPLRACP